MRVNDHGRNPPPTSRTAQLVNMTQFDAHAWPDADTERVLKAKAASLNLQFAATSMRITLLNRQLPKGRAGRCVIALLRAEHNGKRQWVDDARWPVHWFRQVLQVFHGPRKMKAHTDVV